MGTKFRFQNEIIINLIASVSIFFVSATFVASQMASRHYFRSDDISWLHKAHFQTFAEIFPVLPQSIYNDRPFGAFVVKTLYSIWGLNFEAFLWFGIVIYATTAVLMYFYISPYLGKFGAFVSSLVAGLWFITSDVAIWTGGIFDLLVALLVFSALLIFRYSLSTTGVSGFLTSIALGLVFFLAVRTKEMAIVLPVVLIYAGVFLEKSSFKKVLRTLVPTLIIFSILFLIYLNLIVETYSADKSSRTNLGVYQFNVQDVFSSLVYYPNRLFYDWIIPNIFWLLLIALTAIFIWKSKLRFFIGFILISFVGFLGPVLLMGDQRADLYLYLPHFFVASSIGVLISVKWFPRLVGLVLAATVVLIPLTSSFSRDVYNFYDVKTADYVPQLEAFNQMFPELKSNSTVVIYGLLPAFNVFASGKPGDIIEIQRNDDSLTFFIELSESESVSSFCKANSPKLYLELLGNSFIDKSLEIQTRCQNTSYSSAR